VLWKGRAPALVAPAAQPAALLAHLAEVDERRLYLSAGYHSMYLYCVDRLRLSEDSACKRIRAARTARQFPAIFTAVAEGRLHLGAVVLLAPHLTTGNADELLAAAAHQSKAAIEQLLAQRFPRPDVPTELRAIAPSLPPEHRSPGTVEAAEQPAPGLAELSAPGRMDALDLRPKTVPLAPQRFAIQLTMSQALHDKLRYAQTLLSHQIPAGDLAAVLERALDALIPKLEKRKFAATTRPRRRRATAGGRQVPAHVKRAVWKRDGGRCTFVGETGHRCPARTRLEFDHIDPVARGGEATVERMRLRCRAHNQHEAERTFGTEFMKHKRQEARRTAAGARASAAAEARRAAQSEARARAAEKARAAAEARARAAAAAAEAARERDVVPWLRQLGLRADEARRAAAHCEAMPDASLEQRVRAALSFLSRARFRSAHRAAAAAYPDMTRAQR
jgi:5-methylcytosine-specific restriction endonuclease McrA